MIQLFNDDCLEAMKSIPSGSVDMILQDPPYNTTACKWEWDIMTKIDEFWAEWKRIIKPNGAIVMTASQPFTSDLVCSNRKDFRYDLKWIKSQGTGFYNANRMPLRAHEDVLVFYKSLPIYNPQKTEGKPYIQKRGSASDVYAGKDLCVTENETGDRHPLSWVLLKKDRNKSHPTQKPVALMEYLIRTYTHEGDTVFDGFAGSGTTAIACLNTGRKFIGCELDETYFNVAKARTEKHQLDIQPNSA